MTQNYKPAYLPEPRPPMVELVAFEIHLDRILAPQSKKARAKAVVTVRVLPLAIKPSKLKLPRKRTALP